MAPITTPVTIHGRYLWVDKERFMIKGVVYQISSVVRPRITPIVRPQTQPDDVFVGFESNSRPYQLYDPLSDEHLDLLEASIPYFRELGLNTLYIYSIDNTQNHDRAMNLLAEAGIYVIVGLSNPSQCINRLNPKDSYQDTLLHHCFRTIDCMAKYSNTLGVIVTDSLINNVETTTAATYARAAIRDVKAYMRLAAGTARQRVLPVGISSAKIANLIRSEFKYFAGGDRDSAVDFFCFSEYSWVGESSMQISGYNATLEIFAQSPIPIFFSEYGSNTPRTLTDHQPRRFHETPAIYSPAMTKVYSGACVYEFFEAANRYGLVDVRRDLYSAVPAENAIHSGQGAVGTTDDFRLYKLPDFENLKAKLKTCRDVEVATEDDGARPTELEWPPVDRTWKATAEIPDSPVDWEEVRTMLEDREWVVLPREMERVRV